MLTWVIGILVLGSPLLIFIALYHKYKVVLSPAKRKQKQEQQRDRLISIPQYKFNYHNGRWEKFSEQTTDFYTGQINMATFNTLFDLYTSRYSKQRYDYQTTTLLPSLNADIIALNEVTKHYLTQLLEQPWVRKNYYVSRYSNKREYKRHVDTKHFFNIIISRKPFHTLHNYWFDQTVNTKRAAIIGLFKNSDGSFFSVCGAHLAARQENYKKRAQQVKELLTILRDPTLFTQDKVAAYSSILMGDMNLQQPAEELQFYLRKDLIVKDIWKELRPDEKGYTLDAYLNPMITYGKTLNGARLRLDRIFTIQDAGFKSTVASVPQIELFAHQAIDDTSSIFPSDHFGLKASVDLYL